MFVGIDNGISGAVAVIDNSGSVVDTHRMPVSTDGRKNRVDPAGLRDVLPKPSEVLCVAYERVSGSKSATALASMSASYATVNAVLTLGGYRRMPITAFKWQGEFWPRKKGLDTKAAALAVAWELWPSEKFLATDRSSKPHDGIVDALLIAEFCRRLHVHDWQKPSNGCLF